MFIHEIEHWTDFVWDKEKVTEKLMQVSEALGYMHGRLSLIGFDEQLKATTESITEEVVSTSQIEGISLNTRSVRSSVARRLGVPADGVSENTAFAAATVETDENSYVDENAAINIRDEGKRAADNDIAPDMVHDIFFIKGRAIPHPRNAGRFGQHGP